MIRQTKKFVIAAIVIAVVIQLLLVNGALPIEGLPAWLRWSLAGLLPIVGGVLLWRSRKEQTRTKAIAYTCAYFLIYDALLFAVAAGPGASLRSSIASYGLAGIYLIGLAWFVWLVERLNVQVRDSHAGFVETAASNAGSRSKQERIWNPLDARAWYYGRQSGKLHQSIVLLVAYSIAFFLAAMVSSSFGHSREIYEIPGGGGGGGAKPEVQAFERKIRLKKVVKKKFVINPYSSIIFTPPPIDNVALELDVKTKHLYRAGTGKGGAGFGSGSGVGYGDGDGSGFAGGTGLGKIRFIRLEYPGGDWDQDFGVGADLNLLVEYGVRTGQKVSDQTESRPVSALASFPIGKSPPMVYLTGQRSISLSKPEIKTLREYLIDKHGMLFGDNGGSWHFHSQFFDMMRQALPGVEPVKVPLDDVIHRIPYQIPFLPYAAPHGGKDAWGWKVDGRWVCYYHPGDIGDCWSDGHSGVPREVWEACYQLGTNVIFYAHMEYAKWLVSRGKQ